MDRMEKRPPAGFIAAPRETLGVPAWLGPAEGRVSTTLSPTEGVLVHLEDAEDLNTVETEELVAQLCSVLDQLRNR